MNGVEILSSAEVACEFAFNWIAFWIGFGLIIGFCLLMSIPSVIKGECDWWTILICLFVGIVGGSFIGLMIGEAFHTPTAYETHYKVTIEDSVSMNEFLDKYEIIDQEGKIYTVKERE